MLSFNLCAHDNYNLWKKSFKGTYISDNNIYERQFRYLHTQDNHFKIILVCCKWNKELEFNFTVWSGHDLYESVVRAMIFMNQLSVLWFIRISCPCYDWYESVVRAMIYMNQLSMLWFIGISCPCYDLYESVVGAMIYMNQLSVLWLIWISCPCYDLYESVVRAMIYMNQLSMLFSNILRREIPTLNDNSFMSFWSKIN